MSECFPKLSRHYYFGSGRGAKYCDYHVCLFVCPLAHLEHRMSEFHHIFVDVICAAVRSFVDGNAIHCSHVLLVSWMM